MAYWGKKMALNPTSVRGSGATAVSARLGNFFLLPAILIFSIAVPCQAQDTATGVATADVDEVIDEVVVTGSRIKRRDFNTPSPLTTISNEVIAFSGQATIEETLNQMPQVMPQIGRTSNNPSLGNNPGIGGAEVDLRGFGPNRSLVLLNGRRVAPSSTDNRVDLNNFPQFLIDRVEIITGGTSTVYGSDAIAGVVNFITRVDYSGFGVEAGFSMSEPGDAETYDLNLAYGHNFANGRGNVIVYTNMLERKPLFRADREFTRVAYWDDGEGGLIEAGSGATPAGDIVFPRADFGNGPADATFNPDGTPREFIFPDDMYNYAPVNYLQIPLSRLALGVMGHYDLSERFETYLEASFIRNEPAQNLASVPAWLSLEINLDNPVLTPEARQLFADYYTCAPNLACVFMLKRLLEMGPRLKEWERDYSRMVAGFKGELWLGWDIDGWVTYTTASSTQYSRNDASESRYLQGLLVDPTTNECYDPTGGCVPLNIFGEGNLSAEGVEFIRFADFTNVTERTQKLASVFVTGSPIDTWAGSLDMAVGVEWRSGETFFKADNALFTGDAIGYNGQSAVNGTDEVFEIYTEAVIPLASDRVWAKYLGLEVGGRYSEHKHAGGVWTYKVGGEWQLFDGLRLRAMHQRSVRAPNSGELFEEQRTRNSRFVYVDSDEDPCSASADPVGNGLAEKCTLQGLPEDQIGIFEATPAYPVDYISGGNPNLTPETGETWTLGAVITPESLSNWTFTIDYFALEVTDTIGSIDAALICFDPINTGNLFCENISRDASGNVAQITELTSNRGLLETTGIDTQIQYAADLPDFLAFRDHSANISVNLYWTHMLTNKVQENAATQIIDCAGYFGWPCDTDSRAPTYSKNRVTSNIHYASGPLGLHLTWRWIEGTDNAAPLDPAINGFPPPNLAVPEVGDEHYLDLGLAYEFGEYLTARFGINNLLDNDPPQMADAVFGPNTDPGLYDVFGRSYYLTLSAHF
jgi:outer membrane receptor protein involved in Fe transport